MNDPERLRYPPLDEPALLFAHRGARAHAPESTIEAFELGLRLGAGGLEAEVWATGSGTPVLHPDGAIGGRLRRRPIVGITDDDLPDDLVRLDALYASCGAGTHVMLRVGDPAVVPAVLDVARRSAAVDRLWLAHPDPQLLRDWRGHDDLVRLVNVARPADMDHGPERRAAQLREFGVDAVSMDQSEWSAGMVALFHRFRRRAIATGAQHERIILALLDAGVDGIVGDHVDRLVDAARTAED